MPYTIEREDEKKNGTVKVAITVPWSELATPYEEAVTKESARLTKQSNVKGFRKGHVPEDLVKGQVDRMQILSQSVDDVIRVQFGEIIKNENLKVAVAPQVNVKKMAEGNDVEIDLVIALVPEVALPKEWKKIAATVNKEYTGKTSEVSDDEVLAELSRIADSRTTTDTVERAAADGDQVKIDFDVKQDGVLIEGGSSKDHELILGKGAFIPGFEEQVIGLKAGEQKSFELSFPEKYHADHLAGKKATFDVTVQAVQERKTPEINDAFAASLGGTFSTLEDLKKDLVQGMNTEKKQTDEEARKTAYLEGFAAATDVVLPDLLVNDEIGRMTQEMEGQVSQSGMTFDDYLSGMKKTREDLQEMWKPQAEKRIISAMLLEKLGLELEIEPKKEDVEVEMNKTLAMYQGMKDMENKIDTKQLYEYTKGILRNNQVFDILEKE